MQETIKLLLTLIVCHLVGDYVLQSNFLATTKGMNWYHMFVHCALYCIPFYVVFGFDWRLSITFITHIIIDPLKARYNKISYVTDQVLHYIIIFLIYSIEFNGG